MKITCPTCSAKYSIADDKVERRLAKIRCRKCGATIVIDGKVSPPHVYAAEGDAGGASLAPAESAGETAYSIDLGGGEPRTMSVAEIVAAYAAGQVTSQTFVWAEGFADWKAFSAVPELADAVKKPAAKATVSRSASSSRTAKTPWDDSSAKAAPRAAARSGGRDLFGGIATAGSEEEVTTSVPEEAPQPLATSTGARNESSVLFSLAALTSSSPSNPPAPMAPTKTKEDSGLIDLKALAAAGDQNSAAMMPPAPLLGLAAPLGLAPPLGGGVESTIAIPPPPPKSKAPMFVAAAVVLAGVGVMVTLAATSGSHEPAAPPAPSVVYIEKTVKAPESEAKPPSTGDTEVDAGAKKKVGRYTGGRKKVQGGSSESASESGGSSPPAEKPKSGACPPGDLPCQIRLRAKGGG